MTHNNSADGASGSAMRCSAVLTGLLAAASLQSVEAQTLTFADPVVLGGLSSGGAISTAGGNLTSAPGNEILRTRAGGTLQILTRSGSAWTPHDLPNSRTLNRYGGDTALADLDSDGHLDIVLPESGDGMGAGNLWWYRSPGTGATAGWQEIKIASWSGVKGTPDAAYRVDHMSDVEVADLDGDGLLDIVTRDVQQGAYLHFQNRAPNGSGGFDITWTQKFISTNSREGLQLGDLNGDGHIDITFNGMWWRNPGGAAARGGAGYDITTSYTHSGTTPFEIDSRWYAPNSDGGRNEYATKQALGDVNGDGRLDIVISNAEVLGNGGNPVTKPLGAILYLASSDPDASITDADYWTRIALETQGASWHNVRMGDLDGDGDLDIFLADSNVGTVQRGYYEMVAWLNNGSAGWSRRLINDQPMYSGILLDADADGDLDIVGPREWNSGAFVFYENTTVPEPIGAAGGVAALAAMLLQRRRRRTHDRARAPHNAPHK